MALQVQKFWSEWVSTNNRNRRNETHFVKKKLQSFGNDVSESNLVVKIQMYEQG